jgi:hypothetical protein
VAISCTRRFNLPVMIHIGQSVFVDARVPQDRWCRQHPATAVPSRQYDISMAGNGPANEGYIGPVDIRQFAPVKPVPVATLTRARTICGAPHSTAAISSMLSGPPAPASHRSILGMKSPAAPMPECAGRPS